MTRASIILSVACVMASLNTASFAAETVAKPNILMIVADDLGWGDVGWHNSKFRTPALNRLVAHGVELDRHYVQPSCSPTRTALLSGRWTGRFGPQTLKATNLRCLPAGTVTLATALQQSGYSTAMAGKWHLGSRVDWGPNHYGFDHSYGSLSGAADPWKHTYRKGPWLDTWHRDLQPLKEEGNATELVAQEVIRQITSLPEPWFIYVPFHAVHIPIDSPDEYQDLWSDAELDADPVKNASLRRMAAFVSQLDAKVGEFAEAVAARGLRQRTLTIFTSDNGGKTSGGNAYVSDVPPAPVQSSNKPLRGEKGSLFEGGIRVAAFVNWPDTLKPGKVAAPMHAADWMPTLTRLVGWARPDDMTFDGQDVWPAISGAVAQTSPRTLYIRDRYGWCVIRDGWKLIVRDDEKNGLDEGDRMLLFDIESDPSETKNRLATEPDRAAALRQQLVELHRGDVSELPSDLVGIKD